MLKNQKSLSIQGATIYCLLDTVIYLDNSTASDLYFNLFRRNSASKGTGKAGPVTNRRDACDSPLAPEPFLHSRYR